MGRIQRLSAEVASRIAAGEVIERPSSMLKELLENSLDAGAGRIWVEASGAGKISLRVSDDGSGMDPEDCALCLERHATSKIERIEDLQSLRTFGFRGEALYAVAAVSRMTISSCARGAKSGWRVSSEGGKILSSSPAPAVPGTAVEVKDLFFNTPARLKFLKSDAFEKGRLASALEEAALANPEVHFTYKSEGRRSLDFEPQTSEDALERDRARLSAVLGLDLSADLLPIVCERPGLSLRLFVSPADSLVATRSLQYWFINRRPVEARILQQALYRAYAQLRSKDRHPVCVGRIELSPDAFDVNVHPGKREIRFKSDREIFEIVSGLVASALLKSRTPAPITTESRANAPLVREGGPIYRPAPRPALRVGPAPEPALNLEAAPAESFAAAPDAPRWFTPPYRYLGQIEKSYLVFEASGGLFVLDQHAAAERILFEKYLSEISRGGAKSQKLMLPLPIELPASAIHGILSRKERLERLGFEIEPFGKTTLHVLAAPALFEKAADLKEMALRLLESLSDPVGAAEATQHDAVATIACKAAVKAHDTLGEKEAMGLIESLKDCRDGSSCPHGRRTMLALGREELARRFQRPGAPPL